MWLNHLIALVIGCNARKLTCTSYVELSGFSKVSILQWALVYASHWLFIAFQDDSLIALSINTSLVTKKLMYFCGHFQLLELLWTNCCGFIFLFYHFFCQNAIVGVVVHVMMSWGDAYKCFPMRRSWSFPMRMNPCRSLVAVKGEWLLLLSPSNKQLQNCHRVM